MKSNKNDLKESCIFLIAFILVTFTLLSSCEAKIKSISTSMNTTTTSNNNNNNLNTNANSSIKNKINEDIKINNNNENSNTLLQNSNEKITKLPIHQISEKTTQFLQSKTQPSLKVSQNSNPSYNSVPNANYNNPQNTPYQTNQYNNPQNTPYQTNQYNYNNNINYSSDPDANYGSARNIACNQFNCQFPNFCIQNNSVCRCAVEFAEYELNKPLEAGDSLNQVPQGYIFCSYRKKNQIVYFLLELLLNVGAGHFYAGNIVKGVLKLLLTFVPCIAFCVLLCLGIAISDKVQGVLSVGFCLICLLICGISVWWIVDLILIGIRKYTDGNGVPLNPW